MRRTKKRARFDGASGQSHSSTKKARSNRFERAFLVVSPNLNEATDGNFLPVFHGLIGRQSNRERLHARTVIRQNAALLA